MSAVIEATGLGKRYGRKWALSDCTLAIPDGQVVGLVGPNGAGKSTLLNLAVGLLRPTTGSVSVLGSRVGSAGTDRARVGFVAQDTPVYGGLSVGDHLDLGRWTNPGWDAAMAEARIARLGLDLGHRAGKLSGGQRAQLALTLAVGKQPDLLVLDEPVASLDPLARREFLQGLMEVVAETGTSVVLSSHLVADLERVCDYVVVLVGSRVQVTGTIDELLATHRRLVGPRRQAASLPSGMEVLEERHSERQSTFVVRTSAPVLDPSLEVSELDLEDLVLAYLGRGMTGGARRVDVETPGGPHLREVR